MHRQERHVNLTLNLFFFLSVVCKICFFVLFTVDKWYETKPLWSQQIRWEYIFFIRFHLYCINEYL